MSTNFITRVAAYFMCFFLIAPDALASTRALVNGIAIGRIEENSLRAFVPPVSIANSVERDIIPNVPTSSGRLHRFTAGPKVIEAVEQRALIGQSALDPMNNPRDDFFSFEVTMEDLQQYSHAIIKYDLKGLSNAAGIVKAINDRESFGHL